MAINFPDSPTVNQTYAVGDRTWKWTGATWDALGQPAVPTTNAIINGAFDIWQRGPGPFTTSGNIGVDMWRIYGTYTATQDTDVLAGIGAKYSLKIVTTSAVVLRQVIENGALNNGTARTTSFYAKVASGTASVSLENNDNGIFLASVNTSWQRFSGSTASLLAGSGGANTIIDFEIPTGTTIWITGVQHEAGSVATPFKRNAPSIGLEKANCQRYLPKWGGSDAYEVIGMGQAATTTSAVISVILPVAGRTQSGIYPEWSTLALDDGISIYPVTGLALSGTGEMSARVSITVSSGLTVGKFYRLLTNNSLSGYLRLPMEV